MPVLLAALTTPIGHWWTSNDTSADIAFIVALVAGLGVIALTARAPRRRQ